MMAHEHAVAHDHTMAPSGTASVVLDLGGQTGALIVYTDPDRCGQEVEVSSLDEPEPVRTHAAIRARHVRPDTVYGVVIAGLRAGRYVIWQDPDTPLDTVTIASGAVTEYWWSEAASVQHRSA